MPSNPIALSVLKREPRLCWDIRSWFDKLTTNGKETKPFILSLSKDGPA